MRLLASALEEESASNPQLVQDYLVKSALFRIAASGERVRPPAPAAAAVQERLPHEHPRLLNLVARVRGLNAAELYALVDRLEC